MKLLLLAAVLIISFLLGFHIGADVAIEEAKRTWPKMCSDACVEVIKKDFMGERDGAIAAKVSESVAAVVAERDRLREQVLELRRQVPSSLGVSAEKYHRLADSLERERLRAQVSQLKRQITQWRVNELARDHFCAGKSPSECVQITFHKATEWVVPGELNTLKTCDLNYTAIDRETAAYVVPHLMECNTDTYKVRFVWPWNMAGKLVLEKSTPINGEVRTAPSYSDCPGKPQVFSSTLGRWLCVVPSGGSPHCYTPGPNEVLRSDDPPLCPEVFPLRSLEKK